MNHFVDAILSYFATNGTFLQAMQAAQDVLSKPVSELAQIYASVVG